MKKIITIGITVLGVQGAIANQDPAVTAATDISMKPVGQLWTELSPDMKTVRLLTKVTYANNCASEDQVFVSKNSRDGEIKYNFYRSIEADRNCLKVYLPVDKIYEIDKLSIEEVSEAKEISVNGKSL